MKPFRSTVLLWALSLTAFYWTLAAILPTIRLLTILNGIFLGAIVAAAIVFSPLLKVAFTAKVVDRVSQLALGISLMLTTLTLNRFWWLYVHINGDPKLRNSPILGAIYFLYIISICLMVNGSGAPKIAENNHFQIFTANRRLLLLYGTTGGVFTFVVSVWMGLDF
jgi:hypothetical protein